MTADLTILTKAHLCESIKWITKMSHADRWNLSDDQIARLLGLKDAAAYKDLAEKADAETLEKLPAETIERLSILLGIWKTLQLMAPNNRRDLAFSLFSLENATIFGEPISVKNYLLNNNSVDHFYKARDKLQAQL